MSDYWKSAPKYWCKHCGVFVRDTKLERSNHEVSGKHQTNLKRFLRNIHQENEREERDRQRAKDEIARLNGGPAARTEQKHKSQMSTSTSRTGSREASLDERKQHLAKLAEMGVAIPEQHRQNLAMAGEWQAVSQNSSLPAEKPSFRQTISADDTEKKRRISLGSKRPPEDADLIERDGETTRWVSATKRHKASDESDVELNTLLQNPRPESKLDSIGLDAGPPSIPEESSNSKGINKNDGGALSLLKSRQNDSEIKAFDDDRQVFFKKRKKKAVTDVS